MLLTKYISDIRDSHNNIIGYKIEDLDGISIDVKVDSLKREIKSNKLRVVGLYLDVNDNIVTTEERYKKLFLRSKLFGQEVVEIPTYCGHKCYLISTTNKHIIYIPPDVKRLNLDHVQLKFTEHIQNLKGELQIIGGSGLEDTNSMFRKCKARFIDLSNFETINVNCMHHMFAECEAKRIDFSNFYTGRAIIMNNMFMACKTNKLDLSGFDTSHTASMYGMFFECKASVINLSSFNTKNITNMNDMFSYCETKELDLSSFDTSNTKYMSSMFGNCKAKHINLSSFDTSKVEDMAWMFEGCEAEEIDLSNFDTSSATHLFNIFNRCKAKIISSDQKLLERIHYD